MSATNNHLHNPFQNRFNDPVQRREDDMQAYENMVWLRQRNQPNSTSADADKSSGGNGKSAPGVSHSEAAQIKKHSLVS